MASRYAESTQVSSEESRNQIERVLRQHGATAFGYATQGGRAEIMFDLSGRRIRFGLNLPDWNEDRFRLTPGRKLRRSPAAHRLAYEQAVKQSWRALYLVIRAKLEAVEAGISSLDDEFLAHIQLPSGETFGPLAQKAIDHAYSTGQMPALLPGTER